MSQTIYYEGRNPSERHSSSTSLHDAASSQRHTERTCEDAARVTVGHDGRRRRRGPFSSDEDASSVVFSSTLTARKYVVVVRCDAAGDQPQGLRVLRRRFRLDDGGEPDRRTEPDGGNSFGTRSGDDGVERA